MKKINIIFLFLHFVAILIGLWLLLITISLHIIIYLYKKLSGPSDLEKLEISMEETNKKARKYADSLGIDYDQMEKEFRDLMDKG